MADLCVALGFMEVACQRMNAEVEELKKRSDKKNELAKKQNMRWYCGSKKLK